VQSLNFVPSLPGVLFAEAAAHVELAGFSNSESLEEVAGLQAG
jgi:hypothetical protein